MEGLCNWIEDHVHMEECTPIRNMLSEHPKLNLSCHQHPDKRPGALPALEAPWGPHPKAITV